jgi:hypothetical protein
LQQAVNDGEEAYLPLDQGRQGHDPAHDRGNNPVGRGEIRLIEGAVAPRGVADDLTTDVEILKRSFER